LFPIVFLIFSFFVSRTFSFYEEHQKFDVIKGKISNQNYDTSFSFFIEDEQKNMKNVSSIPSGKDYTISVVCDKGAIGSWNYEKWAPVVRNLTETRTKCQIIFREMQPTFLEVIKKVSVVSSGDGLYEVHHENSDFTETFSADLSENQISQFGETELRYVGNNPNNYVKFNDELWRIIGFVNTPEGQRVKLIRNESIGSYSWDSSDASINGGSGVNEWSVSSVMTLLNDTYYNRKQGTCFVDQNNQTTSCDFNNIGLTNSAKEKIELTTWNTGAFYHYENTEENYGSFTATNFYNSERSNQLSKDFCTEGEYCNDQIQRQITWQGQIGLIYLSDYYYATSGNNNRTSCLNDGLSNWQDTDECYKNDWLFQEKKVWTMITEACKDSQTASRAIHINERGSTYHTSVKNNMDIFPVLYLKENLKVLVGEGTLGNPFILS